MNNCLRQLRIQYSLTQEVLAEMLRVSRQTIISIESGRFNPSLDLALKISNIFKIPIEQFIGDVDEAMQDAFNIPDFTIAAHLAEQYVLRMIAGSRVTAYLDWVRKIPESVIYERSYLCVGTGWAYALSWQPDIAERYVKAGEKALSRFETIYSVPEGRNIDKNEVWGHLIAIRAHCARIRGEYPQSIDYCRQALTQLPPDTDVVRCIASLVLGQLYLERGELNLAHSALTDAFEAACRSGDNPYAAVAAQSLLGIITAMRGNFSEAGQRLEQAFDIGSQQKGTRVPIPAVCMTYAGMAAVHYQRDELAAAAEKLNQGLALAKLSGNREALTEILLLQARIATIMGSFRGAESLLNEAEASIQHQYPSLLIATRGELHLAEGDRESAECWLRAHGIDYDKVAGQGIPPARFREYLVLARLLLFQEKFAEITVLLNHLTDLAGATQNQILRLETVVLQATAYYLQGQNKKALDYLRRALLDAEPEGLVRAFIDFGAPILDLLSQVVDVPYTEKLREHITRNRPPLDALLFASSLSALSEREAQVLRLLADDLTKQEISGKLMISMSTVRSHIKNIQRKLNAQNQDQIVPKAKQFRLI